MKTRQIRLFCSCGVKTQYLGSHRFCEAIKADFKETHFGPRHNVTERIPGKRKAVRA